MRLSPRFAPLPAALVLVFVLALALLFALPQRAASHPTKTAPHARVHADRPFGAECRIAVDGSYVTAYCHNPYPEVDRVGLHIECERWWDIDSDGSSVEAGPAQTVRLTGRCWQEVRSAWVSHRR
ncbi:hypothetical protein [Streptomyces sporangiiformans]|uniref:Uncharacterized protein n=1 Tax=Streptomyces sporangiiformans TaxID=2315329 RepID=A0A505DAU9_9ACTN|nr:hypothetical protein [Streptomyces sporangiiformans]TPQ19552.1 hypothetical protein FGD71_025020 [Streptomyces sporangiiformans]